MAEMDWPTLWGPRVPYRPTWGVPTHWRNEWTAGRVLGEALTDEIPHPSGTVAVFQFGAIVWGSSGGKTIMYAAAASVRPAKIADIPRNFAPPVGVQIHYTGTTGYVDARGVFFFKTQSENGRRDLVWSDDGKVRTVVLEPGGSASGYGNGTLVVWPDGFLYHLGVTPKRELVVSPVPNWTRLP